VVWCGGVGEKPFEDHWMTGEGAVGTRLGCLTLRQGNKALI
jgi:hypothetical protein